MYYGGFVILKNNTTSVSEIILNNLNISYSA